MRILLIVLFASLALPAVPEAIQPSVQGDEPPPPSAQSSDGRQIRLLAFEIEENSTTTPDPGCKAPPADYEVARIRVEIVFAERHLSGPRRVELRDVLDRSYLEECQTQARKPTVLYRRPEDIPPDPPLPHTVEYVFRVPIRPRTPIKVLFIDDVEFRDPATRTAPNYRLQRSPRSSDDTVPPG